MRDELVRLVDAGCELVTVDEPSMSCYAWREDVDRLVDVFNRTVEPVVGRDATSARTSASATTRRRAVAPRRYAPMFPAFLRLAVDELHLEMASREFAELELIEEIGGASKDVGVGVIDVKSYVRRVAGRRRGAHPRLPALRRGRAAVGVAGLRALADGALGGARKADGAGRGRASRPRVLCTRSALARDAS